MLGTGGPKRAFSMTTRLLKKISPVAIEAGAVGFEKRPFLERLK